MLRPTPAKNRSQQKNKQDLPQYRRVRTWYAVSPAKLSTVKYVLSNYSSVQLLLLAVMSLLLLLLRYAS